MKLPDHLSFSSLNLYQQCPFKWYLKYVEGVDIFANNQSISTGKNAHTWVENLYKGITNEITDADMDYSYDSFVEYSKYHYTNYCKKVVGVEREIKVNFKGMPPIIGRIDLLLLDGVVDIKTTSKNRKFEMYDKQQLVLYSLWFYLKYGKLPTCLEIHYLHTQRCEMGIIKERVTFDEIDMLQSQFRQFCKDIENDRFTPNMKLWKPGDKFYDRAVEYIKKQVLSGT